MLDQENIDALFNFLPDDESEKESEVTEEPAADEANKEFLQRLQMTINQKDQLIELLQEQINSLKLQLEEDSSVNESDDTDFEEERNQLNSEVTQLKSNNEELKEKLEKALDQLLDISATTSLPPMESDTEIEEKINELNDILLEKDNEIEELQTKNSLLTEQLENQVAVPEEGSDDLVEVEELRNELSIRDNLIMQLEEELGKYEQGSSGTDLTSTVESLQGEIEARDIRIEELEKELSTAQTTEPAVDLTSTVESLQGEIEARDKMIEELEKELSAAQTTEPAVDLTSTVESLQGEIEARDNMIEELERELSEAQSIEPAVDLTSTVKSLQTEIETLKSENTLLKMESVDSPAVSNDSQLEELELEIENLKKQLNELSLPTIQGTAASDFILNEKALDCIEGIYRGLLNNNLENQLNEFLDFLRVKPIYPVGNCFDSELHEIQESIVNPDLPDESIVATIQMGFEQNGTILRKAKIKLSRKHHFCPVCNSEIRLVSKFCDQCGEKVPGINLPKESEEIGEYYLQIAKACLKNSMFTETHENIQKVLSHSKDDNSILECSKLYEAINEFEKSVDCLRVVLERQPGSQDIERRIHNLQIKSDILKKINEIK